MENTVTITVEEYKDLVRVAVEKEFHEQIINLQKQIETMEKNHLEDCQSLRDDSMFWYKRCNGRETELDAAKARIAELEEELSFYKPAKHEEAS